MEDIDDSFQDLEEEINIILEEFVDELARRIRNKATKNAPVFGGLLSTSIDIEKEGRFERNIGTNLVYAEVIETGSEPFTPPLDELKEWARRKLGDESIGAAVWQKIRTKGISPQPYLMPAVMDVLENEADKVWEKYLDRLNNFKI